MGDSSDCGCSCGVDDDGSLGWGDTQPASHQPHPVAARLPVHMNTPGPVDIHPHQHPLIFLISLRGPHPSADVDAHATPARRSPTRCCFAPRPPTQPPYETTTHPPPYLLYIYIGPDGVQPQPRHVARVLRKGHDVQEVRGQAEHDRERPTGRHLRLRRRHHRPRRGPHGQDRPVPPAGRTFASVFLSR